jgi:hypothetical protein
MSPKPDRSSTAGAAYLDLRKLAAATNRPTDELQQLYALEGFLDRLIRSTHGERFVLKDGVLLAAYTERRPTRDVDLAAHKLQADGETIHTLVNEILAVAIDDGLTFDLDKTAVETIRDDADHPGLRAKVSGSLATAMIRFHIDINIGDPIWPEPQPIELPRLLGSTPLTLDGYSAELVLAEKIVTALQRGTANTRWRDFVDIASLSRRDINSQTLGESIRRVAEHRSTPIAMLTNTLDGYADIAQPKWSAWRRKQQLTTAPEEFAELLTEVIAFADPILGPLEER